METTKTKRSMPKPSLQELRDFATLPQIRCTCGRVTGRFQDKFDRLLAEKEDVYYEKLAQTFEMLVSQGLDELTAFDLADKDARKIADILFYKRVSNELGIKNYCCFNTLFNPIQLPLGSGINLDPDVDIGTSMSRLRIAPGKQEEGKEEQPAARAVRVFKAR
jgi:DNA-directed RNA polymerase subunit N (RpoN/RPB10)